MKNTELKFLFILLFLLNLGYLRGELVQDEIQQNKVEHYLKNYDFTRDYFTSNIPSWMQILKPWQGQPDIHYLEIGVSEGRSALWMLENILTHTTAKITLLDVFPKELYERFMSNLILSGFLDKSIIIKEKSQITLRTLPLDHYDIIYIDGSHIAPNVIADAVLSWWLLKVGGIMIFDDYNWKLDRPKEFRPQIAVDAFLNIFESKLQVIEKQKQVIIRKLFH